MRSPISLYLSFLRSFYYHVLLLSQRLSGRVGVLYYGGICHSLPANLGQTGRKGVTKVRCVTGTTLSVLGKSCGKRGIMVINNDVIEYVCQKSCQ